MSGKVSRGDIAENLGLSLATVKRALGNYVGVDKETKERVISEAERLGYKFVGAKAESAVIMPSVPSYFWSELRAHLDFYVKKEGIGCRFYFFHDVNHESDALQCIDRALDGGAAVLICALPDTQAIRDKIAEAGERTRIIFIEEFILMESCYYIGENPYEEGYMLAKRYLSAYKDRRRFLVFSSKMTKKKGRMDGFLDALEEEGIVAVSNEAPVSINTKTRAAIWAREIKKHLGRIDCIFYSSGMINLFADALSKLDGGRDIHIIGFDNDESVSFDNVMIAALQDLRKQAEEAAKTAGEYIRNGVFPKEEHLFIKNKLIERNHAQK